jgi:hypothetical protein
MARQLKVYGGKTYVNRKPLRTIIATTTKKRAMEILGISVGEFNNYWCETGNEHELKTALNCPETVFVSEDKHGDRTYKKLSEIL